MSGSIYRWRLFIACCPKSLVLSVYEIYTVCASGSVFSQGSQRGTSVCAGTSVTPAAELTGHGPYSDKTQ